MKDIISVSNEKYVIIKGNATVKWGDYLWRVCGKQALRM